VGDSPGGVIDAEDGLCSDVLRAIRIVGDQEPLPRRDAGAGIYTVSITPDKTESDESVHQLTVEVSCVN